VPRRRHAYSSRLGSLAGVERVRILLDDFAEPAEVDAAEAVMEDAGIPVEAEGGYRKPKPGEAWGEGDEPEWIVLLLLTSTFGAFFVRFFGEAGADSWKGLKKLAMRLRDTRRRPTGQSIPPSPPHLGAIHIRDKYGNLIQEPLYPQGPSDGFWRAWEQIDEPDWSQLDGWFVMWDHHKQAWAAFEPTIGSNRHVYWDRETSKWVEYQPDPSLPPESPSLPPESPSLGDRVRRLLGRGEV